MVTRASRKKIYLDYAASTPVDPEVFRAMEPYFTEKFGNPGSLHSFGQEAIAAVDRARETIAKAVGAEFREVIFTGSATEANNLALRGTIRGLTRKVTRTHAEKVSVSQRPVSVGLRPRLIVSAIEHESVLETARDLRKESVEVVVLPVDRRGVVDLKKLKEALNERTVLVSIMYANNEIGTIQPIGEIAKIIHDFRNSKFQISHSPKIPNPKSFVDYKSYIVNPVYPLLHTDVVQAFQFLDCRANVLGVDLMTLSAHKIYGPKGIGALYVRNQKSNLKNQASGSDFIAPLLTGGDQEFALRSGTENVPSIVGFAKAMEVAVAKRIGEAARQRDLIEYFWVRFTNVFPTAELNSPQSSTIPNILNIYVPDMRADELLTRLDLAGIAASAGSACTARSVRVSHVLRACGYSEERALRSIRMSVGRSTTKKEIDTAFSIFKIIRSKK